MILVAFVLVLVATVMLIIGTFFDAGVAYIWISIGACVATFAVLAASYWARRRGDGQEAARPEPLAESGTRSAATEPSQVVTTGAGGTVTATPKRSDETDESDRAPADEPQVTIVSSRDEGAPAEAATDEESTTAPAAAAEGEPEEEEAPAAKPQPQPRRVAPRRVVRRAPAATAAEVGEEQAASPEEATPAAAATGGASAAAEAESTAATPPVEQPAPGPASSETEEERPEASGTAAGSGSRTRRVVRRTAASGGTREVVRRTAASGGTRKVVRRAAASGGTRRVVRRAAADQQAEEQPAPKSKAKSKPDRSGTRGKRARAVLSEIKGIGPAKQDALLKKFGSLENMAEADIEELTELRGVGDAAAAAIKQALQDR